MPFRHRSFSCSAGIDSSTAVPNALTHGPLFSDYTFAKDSLFAHLNLTGDELTVYEKLHSALAEKIPTPDLLIYLRADLDTLMARIAMRDRPYERGMDRNYIESLRLAYEGFFTAYTASTVLVIDTNNLNIVVDPQAYADVRERIRSALSGTFQQALLQVPIAPSAPKGPSWRPSPRGAIAARLRRAHAIDWQPRCDFVGRRRSNSVRTRWLCRRRLTDIAEKPASNWKK